VLVPVADQSFCKSPAKGKKTTKITVISEPRQKNLKIGDDRDGPSPQNETSRMLRPPAIGLPVVVMLSAHSAQSTLRKDLGRPPAAVAAVSGSSQKNPSHKPISATGTTMSSHVGTARDVNSGPRHPVQIHPAAWKNHPKPQSSKTHARRPLHVGVKASSQKRKIAKLNSSTITATTPHCPFSRERLKT